MALMSHILEIPYIPKLVKQLAHLDKVSQKKNKIY